MNLAWYAKRLSRMSPGEIKGRSADAWLKRRWRTRQLRPSDSDPLSIPEAVPTFASPLPPSAADGLSKSARDQLLRTAEAALEGRFFFFDRAREDLGPDPDWFVDPKTGRRAPEATYAFDINCRDVEEVGTIKYVWEPSRHYQLTVVAGAYFLASDQRYAAFVAEQLRSWWRKNPFLSGVHWTSGIELGVRLISWVWIRRLLAGWNGVRNLFEDNPDFLRQLHHHQDYLARLPSHGSSSNNHLIAEEAGQFAACCAFPWFVETPRWRDGAAATLRREVKLQTFTSGLNKELASSYHLFVLELFLAAAIEGEAAHFSLGDDLWQRLAAQTDALAATIDVRGQPPRQGDADHGRGLLIDDPEADAVTSVLAAGTMLFGACDWWPNEGEADLRAHLWSALVNGRKLPRGVRPNELRHRFEDAGLVLLRDKPHQPDEIWCRCDGGPHGYLSIAAHAHADALSIELRCGGVDLLVDPGTYVYQGEPTWRAYFRSTIAHNCLELDGEDQSVSGGPFMWLKWAEAEEIETSGLDGGPKATWRAAHDGYRRLSQPARHERAVVLDREERRLTVEDIVETVSRHQARLAFHIGPEVDCHLNGRTAHLTWQSEGHRWQASMHLPPDLDWSAVHGQSEPPLGWYSTRFGEKLPIVSLIGQGSIDGSARLATWIEITSNVIDANLQG